MRREIQSERDLWAESTRAIGGLPNAMGAFAVFSDVTSVEKKVLATALVLLETSRFHLSAYTKRAHDYIVTALNRVSTKTRLVGQPPVCPTG
jgi:hypothetical protein